MNFKNIVIMILILIVLVLNIFIGCDPPDSGDSGDSGNSGDSGEAVELSLVEWEEGNLETGSEKWFYFNAIEKEEYYVEWDDLYDGSGEYTADIIVTAYSEDQTDTYFEEEDNGYGHNPDDDNNKSSKLIEAVADEKIYLKVMGYDEEQEGSFAIRVYRDTMPPSFDPSEGMYDTAQVVTISSETPDVTIRYTLDGSIPSEEDGEIYTEAITVSEGEITIKAIAYKEGNIPSKVSSSYYYVGSVPEKKWTFMLWMAACNDLEPFAMGDMNEIEHGLHLVQEDDSDIMDNMNFLVQIDRIEGFETYPYDDGEDWTDTRRYWMRPDENAEYNNRNLLASHKIAELGETSMGDPSNLADFIEFCKENFPAENYALILWDHGSGVRGYYDIESSQSIYPSMKAVCYDYEEDGNDAMYVGEINDCLTDEHSVNFFGIDACLMGMLEIAYEFRPGVMGKFGADYITFSPQYEIGAGWNYERFLNRLKGDGLTDDTGDACYDIENLTASDLSVIAAKEYADAYIPMPDGADNQTQTAGDLSLIDEVKTNFDLMVSEFATNEAKTCIESIQLASMPDSNTNPPTTPDDSFVIPYRWNVSLYKNFDLYDFAKIIISTPDPAITQTAKDYASDLMTSIEDFIIESYGLESEYLGWENGKNGLAFFWPDFIQKEREDYPDRPYKLHWYTNIDSGANYTYINSDGEEKALLYGKLDFLESDGDGVVESWKELLEFWYDPDDEFTPTEEY